MDQSAPGDRGDGAGCSRFVTYFKEKNDLPALEKIPRSDQEGKVELPALPDSEIYGAIEKVRADIGDEKFREIRTAMPMIAKYVGEECKKHNSTAPRNLHAYYTDRLKDMWDFQSNGGHGYTCGSGKCPSHTYMVPDDP